MSFTFNWPRFSDQFHHDAIQMLNTALNKGNKPPIIADKIEVVELEMGTQPPELEIRDIGDLTMDHFRGIFRLTYSGDAHLVLSTKVQANPLNHKQPDIHLMTGSRGMLAARQPLVVPMLLRLSNFRLSSYVVLVVSKQKGITLVFKTDPLQHVDINSTFDSIAVIQKFIQREIEGQLRQMFREDLPGIIHRLSQQWVKAKVEAPYLNKRYPSTFSRSQPLESMSSPNLASLRLGAGVGLQSIHNHPQSLGLPSVKRSRSIPGGSVASSSRRPSTSKPTSPSSSQTTSPEPQNEYESFDPTYGLRPEGLPSKSGFKGFSSLFQPNKGLADLTEEPSDVEEDEEIEDDGTSTAFDVVEWEDAVPGISPPSSISERDNTPEYETIPAVGGGTITRPRILHSQSNIQLPPGVSFRLQDHHSRSQGSVSPPMLSRHHSSGSFVPDIHTFNNPPQTAPLYHPSRPRTPDSIDSSISGGIRDWHSHRMRPPDSIHTHAHLHDPNSSNPIHIRRPNSERRFSVSSSVSHQSAATVTSLLYPNPAVDPTATFGTSPPNHMHPSSYTSGSGPETTVRPSLATNSIHHLNTLSQSNQTLSPYTRSLSHFTVRSVPPRSGSIGGRSGGSIGGSHGMMGDAAGERLPVKAKRKRIFRIGKKKSTDSLPTPTAAGVPFSAFSDPGHPFRPDFSIIGDEPGDHGRGGRFASSDLRQRQFSMPPEFDAEDMNRYFRSNEDLSASQAPSSPTRLSTLQAVKQHMERHQGPGAVSSGVLSPNGSAAADRRQASSTSLRPR